MADFPQHDPPGAEPKEEFEVGLLFEGDDTVDASAESTQEAPTSNADSWDMLSRHASTRLSAAGDVLKSESPSPCLFLSMKTGADVLEMFNPNNYVHGDNDDVFTSKIQFEFTKKNASEAVQHFMFGKNVCQCEDYIDAAKSLGDVSDSPTGMSAKPSHSRPQVQHSISIENEFQYKLSHKERGCFIIFNIENFDQYNKFSLEKNEEPLKYRAGSLKDAFNLKNAAEHLGFEHVRIVNDPKKLEILQWVFSIANANHSDYDCFACAILTHGGNGDILYATDAKMKLTDLTRPFCADVCPTLAGKPKLFFIQACRGVRLDHGKKMCPATGTFDAVDGPTPISDGSSEGGVTKKITIPAEADFLIANSTVTDYYAWRNASNGSWFIQSLCAVFMQYGHQMELMQMMTRVNKMVAYQYESSSSNADYHQKKQIPSIATRLTAEMYFTPKQLQTKQLRVLRATCSPPSSTIALPTQPRLETNHEDVVKKENFAMTAASSPRLVSGNNSVSTEVSKPETNFFPSPKIVSLPAANITMTSHISSHRTCPRSQFPGSLGHRVTISSSIPKQQSIRKLSDDEAYSQSLDNPGFHHSATIAAEMNVQVLPEPSTSRLLAHRCSLPVNRWQDASVIDEKTLRKAMRQTFV